MVADPAPIHLPLDGHPDLFRDPARGHILGPHQRDQPRSTNPVEHPVAGGERRLGCVGLRPQVPPDMPPELDFVHALDVENGWATVSDECARLNELDRQAPEAVILVA
jgi:hypothetical protein